MDKVKVHSFLKELTELSEKYGILIGGCGCCGSPYLMVKTEREGVCKGIGENLVHDTKTGYSCYLCGDDREV